MAPSIDAVHQEIVLANRILAAHKVVDSFGHISARSPENPERFLLSCACAPDQVQTADIMEFDLDGVPVDPRGRAPYLERFIHAAIYRARADVGSVVHSHSYAVIPFSVTDVPVRPVMHVCSVIGTQVPVWDITDEFGDTDLLVSDMDIGRDLARALRSGPAVLMRGHGATVAGRNVRQAVHTAVYLQENRRLQIDAIQLSGYSGIKSLRRAKAQSGKPRTRVSRDRPRMEELVRPRRSGRSDDSYSTVNIAVSGDKHILSAAQGFRTRPVSSATSMGG